MRPALLILLLATAACTSGPDYAGPASLAPPVSDGFVRGDGNDPQQPAGSPWWSSLGDAQLNRLIERALADNPDLDAAAARIRQARASLNERKAAGLPAVNSSALYAKARLPGQESDGGATDLTLYNLGFDSSWELDLFGGQHRAVEAARADIGAREASLDDARVSLSAEVAQTYVALRARQQQLALGDRALALHAQQVALAEQRFNAGTVGRSILLQAEKERDDERALLAPVRADIDAQKDKLAMLVGTTPGTLDAELAEPVAIPLPPARVTVGNPAALLRRRPDIRVAERTLAAQTARIGIAEAARMPHISFLGLFGLGGSSPADLVDLDKVTLAAVPRLSWTLFDFGRSRAKVKGAEAQRDEAAAQYRSTVLGALEDAEGSLSRFAASRDSLADRARAEQQAKDGTELARQRQAAGTIAMSDYLTAQQASIAATQAREDAAAEMTRAFIAVEKALGLGWQGLPRKTGQ
ncbi:NodT family efflux transporter outer membrane factor (OMF) lipoprotein [Sphingobium sp. OAS761]|uniref:efflux transporter outer membrane subunit n=1 Tax=Sphingobium sp. OAS761 TaxID=2817901 RepID=UPI0020A2275A|nr:efflux transporter outer membrane subunit [Sphingobium sp. OAS761]MCP1471694.1 NodT family efflux transporter outer membrane factor (OMF) lipoprotein [Sphingobium sp. OAS761]